jgi:hypothetical protein
MSAVQGTSNLVTYLTAFPLTMRGPNFESVMLNQISMANRMSAARQLLKALECLHKANFVHHSELTRLVFPLLVCMLNILQI